MTSTDPGPREVAIANEAIATLTIPGYPDFLVADGRDVWTTNTDRVEKLSVTAPSPIATVRVPGACGAMTIVEGSLWVPSCSELAIYRVDTAIGQVVARIPSGLADPNGEFSLAAGAGSIWVSSSADGEVCRIDHATNEIVARIPVPIGTFAATFGFGSVWLTTSGGSKQPGSVQRIDPRANRVVATVPVGPEPRFVAAGEGGVWTLNWGDGSVTRINPATDEVAATLSLGLAGRSEGDIDTGAGSVWVRGGRVLLVRIDPSTNQVRTQFGPPAGSGAVRVAGDLVWVTAHDTNTVWALKANG